MQEESLMRLAARRAVRAILLDDDAQIVLLRRTRPGREVYWTVPGGTVESDDASLEDALRRELAEELGATVIWGSLAYLLFGGNVAC
jgi:ADP-ribose pyrophosphatase YjhB (NUDIX family)